ncbi:hypothetical protein MNB_SV-3-19 [hydrothermal vent metagenome]|uniref:Uncharacterized protein n=1 Tax=hydrothermal vent metagenome TaxID=652676 RepID=A0A1W1BM57_9ZZZZ
MMCERVKKLDEEGKRLDEKVKNFDEDIRKLKKIKKLLTHK